MATTPRGYPYPALTDAPAGPDQMRALASAVDTDVTDNVVNAFTVIGRKMSLGTPFTIGGGNSTPISAGWSDVWNADSPVGAIGESGGALSAPVDGLYRATWTIRWDTLPAQDTIYEGSLTKNGTGIHDARQSWPNPSFTTSVAYLSATGELSLAAGDAIALLAFNGSSVSVDVIEAVFTLLLVRAVAESAIGASGMLGP